jgi:hypothetical protein
MYDENTEHPMGEASAAPPSAGIRWFARIMIWLCWIGIGGTLVLELTNLFGAIPEELVVQDNEGASALISSSITVNDPAAPTATGDLRQDLLFRIAGLVPIGLFIWALLSVRVSFLGVGRGDYFGRPTILGLRNFALAVLLHMTAAPAVMAAAKALYLARFEHGQFELSFSLSASIMLQLVFTGAVALISSVMAHGAKLAEENRQFV